jgi:hypothetical protein
MGHELLEIVPIAFLPEDHALAVAIMSYNGRVDFGLLGDYDAMPDLEDVGMLLEASLGELLAAAQAQGRPGRLGVYSRDGGNGTRGGWYPRERSPSRGRARRTTPGG